MRSIFNRLFYLNQILKFKDTDFIKILTGVRKSVKSFLMKLYKQHLEDLGVKDENIIYINFESYESLSINSEEKFRAEIDKRLPDNHSKLYFMFDKIQMVEGWQRVVNGLKTSFDSDVTITGSNADMLSSELATLLSGRYVEILVYPLSFSEFLQVKKINADSRYVDQAYLEYEKYGGFSSVYQGKSHH
ncbi:AAA family ATPase [Enterococcus thailandicus]|uniref:AAA family ATPase n=1 Tax=Enterococcus thailandicus TaxID=417368 RepID=UPI003984EE8B